MKQTTSLKKIHGPIIPADDQQPWRAHMARGHPETFCIDQYRLRFMHKAKELQVTKNDILKIIQEVQNLG